MTSRRSRGPSSHPFLRVRMAQRRHPATFTRAQRLSPRSLHFPPHPPSPARQLIRDGRRSHPTKAITFETLKLAYSPGSDVLLGGEDIRTILFVTVKAPISVLMWESGTPLDASVFDPITACGGPYSALPNPSMDWVHKCLSFCNQTIPVHHSSESSIHGVVTSESHEPGSSRETTHVSGSVSQSFNALLVVLLAMVVASF